MIYNKVWDYFAEIYCINLDRRQDRWEHAIQEFTSVGVLDRVQRVSAVEHQDGRIGLIKSFLKIFKEVQERNIQNVLIFEDDVRFIPENNPISTLEKSITQMGSIEWSLFYLGANTHERCNVFRPNLILLKIAFSAHAVAYIKREAKKYKKTDIVVVNLSGRGDKDVEHVYETFLK